jgi:hypothetical protein
MSEDLTRRLADLPPDARARVESALKATLDNELAAGAAARRAGGGEVARDFSRGIIFSKVVNAVASQDAVVLPALNLDEAQFSKFADRLAQLQRLKQSGPNQ